MNVSRIWAIGLGMLLICAPRVHADFDPQEPLLTPGGFSSADVLREHEVLFAPPPWGWAAYGLTSHWTLGWDYPATLLGYPGGLVRYQFTSQNPDNENSVEVYGAGFPKNRDDSRDKGYRLEIHGTQDWVRFEHSSRISETWRWQAYAGPSYSTYEQYIPNEDVQFPPVTYRNRITPDFGAALEWDVRPWMKVHLNYTYGNTLVFVDQVVHKHMIVGTLHFAPFSERHVAILRNLRFDLSALYLDVPPAHHSEALPLPIYPTLYWQWGGKSDKI